MKDSDKFICFCNKVSESKIIEAVQKGAKNLTQIYDACGAGTGPCGGSCRDSILQIIQAQTPKNSTEISEALPLPVVEAISLFNRRYYWECHEVLEDLWMVEHGKARLFYQGIIQASAALYHVLNANPKGVIKLAEEAQNKLRAYRPAFMSIAVDPLIQTLGKYVDQSREILGGTRSGFDYDLLPQLLIGKQMDVRSSKA